jgi:UDP:flavonoid glycosyltransferase YjiC (YdhE family)
VPDNPPPYTVCEYNLGDLNKTRIEGRVEFVGTFVDMTPVRGSEKHIFASISGPLGTRAKLGQMIIPVLRELETQSVISLGEPSKRITKKMGNCEIHTWLSREEREEYMRNSKIIVFSGGHATCFETIRYGKPSVCIPTQPEQMANAKKIMELNCSKTAKDKEQLKQAIEEIEERKEFYKSNVRKLNKHSRRLQGLDQAVSVIENIRRV